MSNDSGDRSKQKLSTAEILAKARAQAAGKAAGGGESTPPAAAATPAPAEPAPKTPAAAPAKAPAGGAPKSTADILAAARASAAAKGAGGSATPAATAPSAGAKPKSTADILAAARAQAKGGAAPAAAPASAKAAPAAKGAATGGAKPSVQEMLAAVRGEQATAAVAEKPVGPPAMPAKPTPATAGKKKGAETERRSILALLLLPFVIGMTALTGALGAGVLAILRFMMPNVLTEPPSKFKVGVPADFDLGTVSEKFKASNGIWIVHTDKYQGRNLIYALTTVCTHLGCTPSWLEGEQKFKCPCHGSGFYINGVNFEGPAPRPLERAGLRLAEDGMLEVDKSLKFQEEMGQWADPNSFVEV